jgi:hypothetical protein
VSSGWAVAAGGAGLAAGDGELRAALPTPRRPPGAPPPLPWASALEVLSVDHNQLARLPAPLLGMRGLRELDAGSNAIEELAGPMQLMEGLTVRRLGGRRGEGCVRVSVAAAGEQGRTCEAAACRASAYAGPGRHAALHSRIARPAVAGPFKQPPAPPAGRPRLGARPEAAQRDGQPLPGDAAKAGPGKGPQGGAQLPPGARAGGGGCWVARLGSSGRRVAAAGARAHPTKPAFPGAQVVCEQAQMVEAHVGAFSEPLVALAAARGLDLGLPVQVRGSRWVERAGDAAPLAT